MKRQIVDFNLNEKYEYTFTIPTNANKTTYKLEEHSPSDVGNVRFIRTRRRTANNRSLLGNQIVNDNVFESAFLRIKKGNVEVIENTPLVAVEESSKQNPSTGHPIELTNVDWSRSEIFISNPAAIVDNEVFEITIVYDKNNLR